MGYPDSYLQDVHIQDIDIDKQMKITLKYYCQNPHR